MKIVEIAQSGIHLKLHHGFMIIQNGGEEISREPIDDIDCLLVYGYGLTYSHNLLVKLCEVNIPITLCGSNFMPIGFVMSTNANYERKTRLQEQINVTLPFSKKLWQTLIKEKIRNQQIVLQNAGSEAKDFTYLINKVRSGDIENIEAVAARKYWKRLFDEDFKRDFDLGGINSFLNFGYAILRSCVARYLVATGLDSSLGLHHKNKLNTFCLADDMMEPFRSFVDNKILQMEICNADVLSPKNKKELASFLNDRFLMKNEKLSLQNCIKESVFSLLNSYRTKKDNLKFPEFK
jgi:CRISP-associated protein Cas1